MVPQRGICFVIVIHVNWPTVSGLTDSMPWVFSESNGLNKWGNMLDKGKKYSKYCTKCLMCFHFSNTLYCLPRYLYNSENWLGRLTTSGFNLP